MAAVALIATGCNSKLLRPPVTIYADAGGHAIGVTVRDEERRFNSTLWAFLPSNVPLHPGDALNFEVRDTGEAHTIALGRLVDRAVTAVTALGPTAGVKTIEALPEMRTLPLVYPSVVKDDSPRTNRSATEPCFLPTGAPPVSLEGGAAACPERTQPDFNGRQAFYSGGFLEEGEPFRVRLAPDIRAGSYAFMCLVHRASMTGVLEVRAPGVERPRVADVRKQAMDEENDVAGTLEQPARRAAELRIGSKVLAGTGPVGRVRGLVSSFIPDVAEVQKGSPVEWTLYGMHSVSFGASRDAQDGILIEDRDGVRINLDAWRAVGSKPQPEAAVSYPPASGVVDVDGGAWSGEGEFSSGVLRASPPGVITYTLRFSKAGTYRYQCLIHQRMRGRVVVQDAP
jgi:plastocyanin